MVLSHSMFGLGLLAAGAALLCAGMAQGAGGRLTVADVSAIVGDANSPPKPGWHRYRVAQLDGDRKHIEAEAQFQVVNAAWGRENMQMPYLIYMPERKRLLMIAAWGPPPVHAIVTFGDDMGTTWSERRWLHTDALGAPDVGAVVGPTYLGNGLITTSPEDGSVRVFSDDYGSTWVTAAGAPRSADGRPSYSWDPALIDRGEGGTITRLLEGRWKETGRAWESGTGAYSQGYTTFSSDLGKTWSAEELVPQWLGVNEVAMIRARNRTIVAACRTDNPQRFIGQLDLYSGLGISISRDNGRTWSKLRMLYEYGRHHPSMVMLRDGSILMTYVARVGYTDDAQGYNRYGIEAIVSRDHGLTWDLDHRYILATWSGRIKGANAWWGLPQSTSTVLLPDGSLLTAFGMGARNEADQARCIMDVGLVKWRVGGKPLDGSKRTGRTSIPAEGLGVLDLDAIE